MVRVALTPSRSLAAVLLGAHLAAGVLLIPLEIPFAVKLALASAVGASLARSLWRHALLKGRRALIGIELPDECGRVAVRTGDGLWHDARVLETTYVSPLLSVLNLRISGSLMARHMLIVADNVDQEDFRRMRVWLRWGYRDAPRGAGGCGRIARRRRRTGSRVSGVP